MKYEKPVIVDLNGRAASGRNPLACTSGSVVSGMDCATGALDEMVNCLSGTGGYNPPANCVSGGEPEFASCLPGMMATFECAGGLNASLSGSCTSGPSPVI